jgi:ketosteroid isomerase-like protein
MSRNIVHFALSILIAFSCVSAAAQAKPLRSEAKTDHVRTVLQNLFAAWSELEPAKAAPFYAKDADLVFFDIAPMKYVGWAQYAVGVPNAFAPYRSGKFTLNDDLRTHMRGNWAWATATWHAELTRKDGGKEKMQGRYTAVLEKRGDKWLIVYEHMSVPAGP